jgi:twitching motility protein PilT
MVPAIEILVQTARVRELIEDPQRTREIRDAIASGKEPYGMISFDQSLTELVHKKLVTYDEAVRHSSNPDDFALVFRGVTGGGRSDSWQQEQVLKENVGAVAAANARRQATQRPATPNAPSGQVVSDAGPGFDIERFGKE